MLAKTSCGFDGDPLALLQALRARLKFPRNDFERRNRTGHSAVMEVLTAMLSP